MEIISVNISEKKGVIKLPIETGKLAVEHGFIGDAHAGPGHRQVSLLAKESIDKMSERLGKELKPGDFAENLTTAGIEVQKLPVGTRLVIGGCELEITQIGKECHARCAIFKLAGDCVMPTEGVFARVIIGGNVQKGDKIEILADM